MNPLSERARLMLERYRVLETMLRSEKARLWEHVKQANAQGLLPRFEMSAAPSPSSRGPSFGRSRSAPAIRLIVASALLTLPAVAAVSIAVRQARTRAGRSSVEDHVASTIAPAASKMVPAQEVVAAQNDGMRPVDIAENFAPMSPKRFALRKTAHGPTVESTIDEEVHLLNEAQVADDAGDWQRALKLLDEYPKRFPASHLADARAVAHLVVLCKLGRVTAARGEAVRFLSRYPNSPFTDRVQRNCNSKDGL